MLDTTNNTIGLANQSRDLTTSEVGAISRMAAALPGRWIAETERNADGQRYVGLVAPSHDKRTFPVLISGLQDGGLEVEDWTGQVLATGVGVDAAFQAIREALPAGGRRPKH
jgi:hypothetical protein